MSIYLLDNMVSVKTTLEESFIKFSKSRNKKKSFYTFLTIK